MKTTLEIIFAIVLCWLIVGWLFATLKTKYWHNFLIKKEYASKYPDFSGTPWKICLPICLIYPVQAFFWFANKKKDDHQENIMPITPLGGQDRGGRSRSNANFAILNNKPTYYSSYNYPAVEISENDYLKDKFGFGVLSGGFHLLFLVIAVVLWVIALLIYVVAIIVTFSVDNLFMTYPAKKESKASSGDQVIQ